MDNKVKETNNDMKLIGEVSSECKYSHNIYGENFYKFYVKVRRLSDNFDILPIIISERLIDIKEIVIGEKIKIIGQLRSFNKYVEEELKNKLLLSVFTFEAKLLEKGTKDFQELKLKGFICKKPVYRKTPFGREICDLLVAVNRSYNKSDYIPCISWGRYAKFSDTLELGTSIKIAGRLQSRTYKKKISENEVVEKIALEVSLNRIEEIN